MNVTNIIKSLTPSYGALNGSRNALIGICVGHSRKGDNGAVSTSGASEWQYNKKVAESLRSELKKRNINAVVFSNYEGSTYGSAMSWICTQLILFNVNLAVERHFNSSSDPKANGYEFLYWGNSTKGRKICQLFQQVFNQRYPKNKDRGIKPLNLGSRGALFTRLTNVPAVILEPFFGSNPSEWATFGETIPALGEAYADAIELCLGVL